MRVALGIDTGGTYTDAVVVDHATGDVLAGAKALTTRHDLAIGIREAIGAVFSGCSAEVPAGLQSQDVVVVVGLSTTLATNATVEHLRMFLPDGPCDFETLPEAAAYAERVMLPYAEKLARQAGAEHVEVKVSRQDYWARTSELRDGSAPPRLYLGSDLVFIAAGRPSTVRANGNDAGRA